MLCLSTQKRDAGIVICPALYEYYPYKQRWVCTSKVLNNCSSNLLLEDAEFIDDLTYKILLHLPEPDTRKTWRFKKECLLLYPSNRNGRNIIAFGNQAFSEKNLIENYEEIFIDMKLLEGIFFNSSFKNVLAHKILTYLPISEDLCLIDD